MYAYAWDGPVGLKDDSAMGRNSGSEPHGQEGSNYVILTVSVAGMEITWCSGPGISTIFAAKSESPQDYCVLSRRPSA
jgi:hypothetical protein